MRGTLSIFSCASIAAARAKPFRCWMLDVCLTPSSSHNKCCRSSEEDEINVNATCCIAKEIAVNKRSSKNNVVKRPTTNKSVIALRDRFKGIEIDCFIEKR